jgi:hypothetical protein
MAIFRRSPRQAGVHLNERLDPRHIEHDDKPLVLRGQRPDLFPQHREKKALNMIEYGGEKVCHGSGGIVPLPAE